MGRPWSASVATLAALLGVGAATLPGCGDKREIKPADATPVLRDVPDVLRGTVGAESSFRGIEPVLVSGLGIVVGLNGTGGGDLPASIQATMERELALGGIGKGGAAANTELGPVSPQEFLRSPNVAVVIVQAAIPPGAPEGSTFDVLVRTLPGSSVTSLEGGTLWTVDMRFGEPAIFGAVKTRKIAEARGPIFINPFSGSSSPTGAADITRTVGRVLGGGVVTDPLALELVLDNDSHARARAVVSAINSRFPRGRGDASDIAKGRGRSTPDASAAQSIRIIVPQSFRDRPADFIELVRHLRIEQGFQQEYARLYVEALKSRPALSKQLSWCLQALGAPAIPFLAPMYDYPELTPRLAALEAGARLGDARTAIPLADLAKTGPRGIRAEAIRLLADMPPNPTINLTLRELVASPDLDVRIAAYEGLLKRGDAAVATTRIGGDREPPRMFLDIVPGGEPLIYVTQQGSPRVALLGAPAAWDAPRSSRGKVQSGIGLTRPLVAGVWDDRLLLASDSPTDPVRLRYADPRNGRVVQMARVPEDLAGLILTMARRASPDEPEPGVNLTFSEIVGALYEFSKQGAVEAAFATQDDRLRAEIFEASQTTALVDRPETTEGEGAPERTEVFKSLSPAPLPGPAAEPKDGKLTRVVPLAKPTKKK